jgi:3'(2'), 5'-bisphosphate nucleotidase
MTTRDDHSLAGDLAAEAGERLLELRTRMGFDDQRALKDAGDQSSHRFLMDALERLRPGDAVLSEEATREERMDPRRLSASRVWIVDPLDGTREFSEAGRADWAVHVALWVDGALTAGAVALPAQGRTLTTAEPPALPKPDERFRIAVSRTRPPEFVRELAARAGAELVPIGSAGAKIGRGARRRRPRLQDRRLAAALQPGGPLAAGYPGLPTGSGANVARRHP